MRKELDNRNHTEEFLDFECNCGGNHRIEFHYDLEENYKEYYITIIEPYTSNLWQRIKYICNYLFKGDKVYHYAIGLTTDDLEKVKKHMDRYINDANIK